MVRPGRALIIVAVGPCGRERLDCFRPVRARAAWERARRGEEVLGHCWASSAEHRSLERGPARGQRGNRLMMHHDGGVCRVVRGVISAPWSALRLRHRVLRRQPGTRPSAQYPASQADSWTKMQPRPPLHTASPAPLATSAPPARAKVSRLCPAGVSCTTAGPTPTGPVWNATDRVGTEHSVYSTRSDAALGRGAPAA